MEMTREEFQLKQKELEIQEQKQAHDQKTMQMRLELELKKDMLKFEHDLTVSEQRQREQFSREERAFWAEKLLPVLNSFGGGMMASVHAVCEVQKAWMQAQVDLEQVRLQTIVDAIKASKGQP
jgi:hypothetical protein